MTGKPSLIRVKICGLTRKSDVQAAIEAGCDYCGFVHERASPRHLEAPTMAELVALAKVRSTSVMVISDPEPEQLSKLVQEVAPDIIQCHGSETPEKLEALRLCAPDCLFWKAVSVSEATDWTQINRFAGLADALVLDTPPPPDSQRSGGWGQVFDWSLLARSTIKLPYILAGGLEPGNVGRAIAQTGAGGVDVSSGVEAGPGQKDAQKMLAFIAAAREAAQHIGDSDV